jgi:hypothetical protein
MSVETDADKHLAEARKASQEVVEHLGAIVVDRCNGWNGYKELYNKELREAFEEAVRLRDKLSND